MHRLSIWIAGLAVVALIAISIGVNVNFGYRIGGLFLGGLSGAIDFLKIAMPLLPAIAQPNEAFPNSLHGYCIYLLKYIASIHW